MTSVRSAVNLLRRGSFWRGESCCGGRELIPYWRQSVRKGTLSKNVAVLVLLICLPACNQAPTPNPGGPYNGVAGTALAFDGAGSSDPNNDPLTFTWDFGDGSTTATGTAPMHTYGVAGTNTVTLTANDGRGGVASATTTATIAAPNLADPSSNVFKERHQELDERWRCESVAGHGLRLEHDSLEVHAPDWNRQQHRSDRVNRISRSVFALAKRKQQFTNRIGTLQPQ